MTIIPNTKADYIILAGSNNGLTIYMNVVPIVNILPAGNTGNNNDTELATFFTTNYSNKHKNRIILSQRLGLYGENKNVFNTCLITQNNIKNNIKFIHDDISTSTSTSKHRKILFIANQDISDNTKNYLLDNINSNGIDNIFHLNYYFNLTSNHDYFNIKLTDFVYGNNNNTNILVSTNKFKIIDFSSTPIYSNTTNNRSLINYNAYDFGTLFTGISNDTINTTNTTDISISKLYLNTAYDIYNNIYSYNKLTFDFKNINTYRFSFYDSTGIFPIYINNNSEVYVLNTFMIKTNNFKMLNRSRANSTIIFQKNNIFLNNVKAIDVYSNFYQKNPNYSKLIGPSINTIFLSLGKQITGITQRDLYRHTHIFSKSYTYFDISKIVFKKDINSSIITSANTTYNTLIPSLSNLYLLDFAFFYKNANNVIYNPINYNNAINYNNILFNNFEYRNSKVFEFNSSKLIDFSYITSTDSVNYYSNNNYINNLNNLLRINNKVIPTTISYELLNSAIRFKSKNINYQEDLYNFENYNEINTNLLTNIIRYDMRYNYGTTFYLSLNLDILLDNNSLDLCSNSYPFSYSDNVLYYSKLNFYSLEVINLITTTTGSDFENVDCIFIYHDPATETDPRFLYPNNNIEIVRNNAIDTLEKAIILLPGLNNSRVNNTFIPSRNGSNLSRKMIQGLIGLNNVPKLLSIVPYNTNSIIGRGFINQYQIDQDTCNNYEAQVNIKKNAIKYYTAKDTRANSANSANTANTSINTNFANIVRSSALNRISQQCIDNLRDGTATIPRANINTPIVTPFKMHFRR
jgi:hypothetical protein